MGEKKRKSLTAEKPKKKRPSVGQGDQYNYPTWGAEGAHIDAKLLEGQSLVFSGQAVMQVVSGAVEVCGSVLTSKHAPVNISTGGRSGMGLTIMAVPHAEQVPLASTHIVHIRLMPPPGVSPPEDESEPQHAQLFLPGTAAAPNTMKLDNDWIQAIASVTQAAASGQHVVVAACGTKGVGKSSLARLLTNSLLNVCPCVAYLDTDLGQPEFTPPGLVSLHMLTTPALGPQHTHVRQPTTAHFMGDVSMQSDPEMYLSSVESLHAAYMNAITAAGGAPIPLVVNTHGWVKGLGLEVLAQVLSILNTTHVVSVRSGNDKKDLPRTVFWERAPESQVSPIMLNITTLVGVQDIQEPAGDDEPSSRAGPQRPLSAVESRSLMWHGWGKEVVGKCCAWGSYEGEDSWETATMLAGCKPYVVSLDEVTVKFLYSHVPESGLGYGVNAAVVGLTCSKSTDCPAYWPDLCIGLGLVRGVDMKKGRLFLLTSVDEERLQCVDTLVVGKLELPVSLVQTPDHTTPYQALFSLTAEATGAGAIKSRKNIQRASLVNSGR